MATPNRTSKQIAERFKGNLDYFKQPHYWRRLRLWVGLLVFIFGLAAAIAYYLRGPQGFYNAGPVSQAHARFAADCQVCHTARRSTSPVTIHRPPCAAAGQRGAGFLASRLPPSPDPAVCAAAAPPRPGHARSGRPVYVQRNGLARTSLK